MKLSDFDYELPETLIAYYPATQRTESRLLFLNGATGDCQDLQFIDIESLIHPGDLLIFNNTRVFPARLFGTKKTGGKVEILIERILDDTHVLAHIRASKAVVSGDCLFLDKHLTVEVVSRDDDRFQLRCHFTESILTTLEKIGHIPLPPYIKREVEASDRERYQTVYAQHSGSVAAPTAGLHFDEAIIERLRQKGVNTAFLTLHVGAGTFQPVRTERIEDHRLHSEYVEISQEVCDQVSSTKLSGGRVIAVGTTTARSLEAASAHGAIQPFAGETTLFIYPGFHFHCVDAMVTNFHLPKSSLLILIAAFAGFNSVMDAYRHAVLKHYRFFSYGDAMFVTR